MEKELEPTVRPIKLLTIEEATSERTNRYPAVVDAAQVSELSFQVSGLLEELPVKEAQKIEKGMLIAKLDQRDFQSSAASARAQFENAEKEYERAENLAKENAIAKSVLEQRKSQRDVARAQLDSAEKALSDTVLRAPFSGVVAQVPVKALQNVSAGERIATLVDASRLEAAINLPAAVIAQVQTRTNQRAFVILDVASDNRIEAEFKGASLLADSTSQTFTVTFSFLPPDELVILSGMNAIVELAWSSTNDTGGKDTVSVPLAAILSDGDAQYVWVVDNETMFVSKRRVTVEEGVGETLVVTEGLKPGETIAGAGAAYLAEGMQVRPWTN